MMLRWWWVLCWGDVNVMVIMIMKYDENQIDDDGYEQGEIADNLKMIVMKLMSWRWLWRCFVDMMLMVLLVITRPICYHNQMKRMISIYDYYCHQRCVIVNYMLRHHLHCIYICCTCFCDKVHSQLLSFIIGWSRCSLLFL